MKFVLQLGFASYRHYMDIACEAEKAGCDSLSLPDSLF
ncbi:MAG: LLM class F420-dependent oxidoreductase, partial [Proteobacteria bacterium]|nr:LLM class F420-dependent oxidoreductase [Pseudomonadota bacterium]